MKPFLAFLVLAFFAIAPAARAGDDALPAPSLEKIADGVWIHKSYAMAPGYGKMLSQGLVVDMGDDLLLVDTAWTDEETAALLKLVEDAAGRKPTLAVVTHAHRDKMGGMKTLHAAGVKTLAHPLTNEDAPKRGLLPADAAILDGQDEETLGAGAVTVFYPGAGHTRDNIVVYVPRAKVLFGGCLIRPGETDNLGNTADGDVNNWANAVRKVAARFPEAEIVIPTHGPKGGRALLDHTIALAEAAAGE